jgi:MFS family permease
VKGAARRTFRALRHRNYRLFLTGQVASLSGTWMQTVAQAWLVLKLTNSGVALGIITALQFLPLLLFGPLGGLVADRFDKRRVIMATQSTAGVLALLLGVLTATGAIQLWMVGVMAFALGLVTALDNPSRLSFVHDMVGPEDLPNAVSLNTVTFNASRIVGPGIAGVIIAAFGIAPCFFVNAASYGAVVVALALMRPAELQPAPRAVRGEKGQLRAGLRYVWADTALRTPLLMMAVIGTLAYEFQVSLPLLARYTFHGDASTYGALTSVIGAGAVLGGLAAASHGRPSPARVVGSALAFGVLMLGAAAMPTLGGELLILPLMGAASITFIAVANASLQLAAEPHMRGRVMALWSVAFFGTTPIGGPIVGWIGQAYGARAAIALGGVATVVTALVAWRALGRDPVRQRRSVDRVLVPASVQSAAAGEVGQRG